MNRPFISLDRPEFNYSSKGFLEFSPTNAKKNLMVTGNVFRNVQPTKHLTQDKKNYNGNNNVITLFNFSKNDNNTNNNNKNNNLNVNSNNGKQSYFSLNKNKVDESFDDFRNDLDTSPKKESYMAKFSPKKVRRGTFYEKV
jgi:hypothetical protein